MKTDKSKLPDHFPYEEELSAARGCANAIKYSAVFWIAVIAVVYLTGCATITRGSKDALTVDTVPQGAECSLSNGFHCASTPCSIKMPRKSEGTITCKLPGHHDGSATFTHKTAGSGAAGMAGNVLVGGLIGAGIDAGTGATQDLTPNPVVIELRKLDEVY